jgi:hypothetical protein
VLPDGTQTPWTNTYTLAAPDSSTVPPNPITVGAVTYAKGAGNMLASWTAPTLKPDFESYVVEVLLVDNSTVIARYETTETSLNFTYSMNDALNVTPKWDLRFRVFAKATSGTLSTSYVFPATTYPDVSGVQTPTADSVSSGLNWKWAAPTGNADIVEFYEVDVDPGATLPTFDEIEATVYGLNYLYIGSPSTQYTARVRTVDIFGRRVSAAAGLTTNSGAVSGTADATIPLVPSALGTTGSASTSDAMAQITLTWTAGTDAESGIAGHFVRYKKAADSAWTTVLVDSTQNSLVIRNLLPGGTSYDWAVMSQNRVGLTSAYVASTFTTAAFLPVTGVTAASVSGNWNGTSDLTVTWADATSRTTFFGGYEIELTRNNASAVSTTKSWVVPGGTKFVLSAAEFKSVWGYSGTNALPSFAIGAIAVYAKDANGQRSAAVVSTLAATLTAPAAPVISSLVLAPNVITASWAAIPTAVSYDVVAVENAVPTSANIVATVPGTATKATFTGKVTNSAYVIQVRAIAYDVFGQSSGTSAASASTATPGTPAAPTMSVGIDVLGATWGAVTDGYTYEVASESVNITPTVVRATTTGLQATWGTTGQSTWSTRVRAFSPVGTVGAWSTRTDQNSSTVAGTDSTPPVALTTAQISATATATPLDTYKIDLDWSAYVPAEVISKYVVEWGPVSLTTVSSFTTTSTKHTITGLTRGGAAQIFRVKPYDLSNNVATVAAGTNEKTAPTVAAATMPPTGVAGTWNGTTMRVSWNAPATSATVLASDFTGYKVYLARSGYTTKVYETKSLFFDFTPDLNKDAGLGPANDPYCRDFPIGAITVETINDSGVADGTATNAAQALRTYTGQATMNAITVGARAMGVTWTAADGAAKYNVYVGTATLPTTVSQITPGLTATWQTTGTGPYFVRTKAFDAIGTLSSVYSTNESTASAVDVVASDTGPPNSVTATNYSATSLGFDPVTNVYTYDIRWDNVADTGGGFVERYEISYKTSAQTNWTTQVVQPGTSGAPVYTVARITGLIPSLTYNLSIVAVDNAGNKSTSAYVPTALSVPAGAAPTAVTPITAAWAANFTAVDVTFTTPTQPVDFLRYELRFALTNSMPASIPKQTIVLPLTYNTTGSQVARITSDELLDSGLAMTGTPTIYAWVVAVNRIGTTTASAAANTAARTLVTQPTFTSSAAVVDTVTLTWNAVASASRYKIYYGPTGNRTQYFAETTSTSWRVTWVDNLNYYYSIAAIDALTGVESATRSTTEVLVATAIDAKSGKVGGWNLNADTIYNPANSVGLTAGSIADPAYGNRIVRFWAGGTPAAPQTGKFKVYDDGTMLASQGRVGGWEMLSDDIISTGSSIQSVFMPGTKDEYLQTNLSQGISTSNYPVDFMVKVAPSQLVTASAGDRVILGGTLAANDTTLTGLSITSGLTALTSAAAMFNSGMVGTTITIPGAGAGATELETTITAYTSTTAVTVGIAAGTTVAGTGTARIWGDSDTFSIGIDETSKVFLKQGSTTYRSSVTLASLTGLFSDGEAIWLRVVAVGTGGTAYVPGETVDVAGTPTALSVASGNVQFFYGGTATERVVGPSIPPWVRIGAPVACTLWYTSAVKIRIGGIPGRLQRGFIGKISDVFIKANGSLISSFRAADISRATNEAPNYTGSAGDNWKFYGTQVGVSASATEALNSNSLFETGTTGWLATSLSTISQLNTAAKFGTGSMSIVTTGTNKGAVSEALPASGSKRYSLSGYTRGGATALAAVCAIRLVPEFASAAGTTTRTLDFGTKGHGLTQAQVAGATILVSISCASDVNAGTNFNNSDFTAAYSGVTVTSPSVLTYTHTGTYTLASAPINQSASPYVLILLPAATGSSISLAGNTNVWSPKATSTFVTPASTTDIFLLLTLATAGTRYVDGIRLQAGGYTDSFGYSLSATDAIRLESTGSVNIINDYGRIDITNRKQGDASPNIELGNQNFLAPTVKFIGTSRDGSATLEVPAEITTVSELTAQGTVRPAGNSLFLHSGSLYSLADSVDSELIVRKKRAASVEMVSNTNSLAGPLTGDQDPVTQLNLTGDLIRLTGDVDASGRLSAGHVAATARASVGELEIGGLRNLGTFENYTAFEAGAPAIVDAKSSDFVVIDGEMFTENDISDNYLTNGKFMLSEPSSAGWVYTNWNDEAISFTYGGISSPNNVVIVSPYINFGGDVLEEVYVRAAMKVNTGVTESGTFTVEFFDDSNVSQGTYNIDDGVAMPTEWTLRGGFAPVPNATVTKLKLKFKTIAGGNVHVGRVVATGSDRISRAAGASSGLNVTVGTNVVTSPVSIFSQQDLGRRISITTNASTIITGVVDGNTAYVADNATITAVEGANVLYDPAYDKPFLKSWKSTGRIEGPPGPATAWTVSAESIDAALPAEAIVGGTAPNNTLLLKIPAGATTFAQVNTASPIARSPGDLWFDISKAPTVPSLLVSSKEFTDGIQVYNTDQSLVTAKINPTGTASFKGRSGKIALNTTYWESETPSAVLGTDSFQEPRYFVSSDGWVSLSGLVSSKTNGTTPITFATSAYAICTLPAGMRPMNRMVWHINAWVNGAWALVRVDMNVAGELIIQYVKTMSSATPAVVSPVVSPATTVGWLPLTGISFEAWQTGQTFEPF